MKKVKPALLKGFDQEYLPAEQLQFNAMVDAIRSTFELYGFLPIETPSAELKEVLTSKGGMEKEIYALSRLAAGPGEDAAGRGALRFDLTVPLARYVAMREHELVFPFRRYQIQRVWRGENPQVKRGRFREFYQCDIDIIGRNHLSTLAEAEIPSVIHRVFSRLNIGDFRIRINNRKVLRGLLQSFHVAVDKEPAIMRLLDKSGKEDANAILAGLHGEGVSVKAADYLFGLISTKRDTAETFKVLADVTPNEMLQAGMDEAQKVLAAMRDFAVPESSFAFDLGVVRGLDYYTGTIYETSLAGHPDLGSICSGGRYDDLASYFTATKLPGVGISIGLSRLFARLRDRGLLRAPARTPAEVLVTVMDRASISRYIGWANELRGAGINTELYLEPAKLGDQLSYAEKKGFRLALIAGSNEFAQDQVQVKDLAVKSATTIPARQLVATVREMLMKSAAQRGH